VKTSIARVYKVRNLTELADRFLSIANNIIYDGGVIIYPTDTIYGILGRADKREIYERIYDIKKRERKKPFVLLVGSKDLLYDLWDRSFIEGHLDEIEDWEEGVTYIGKMSADFPLRDFFPSCKIAVRYTDRFWVKELAMRYPIIATSPNISSIKYEPLLDNFLSLDVDFIFWVDDYPMGKPSRIIELSENRILRE